MPARLHHERIAVGGPARWLVFTHGIYGSSANWRTIARRVVERRPDWGFALVDLRGHGRSEHGEPPQTIAACAEDIAALVGTLPGVAGLAGHSFGGKVALATRDLVSVAQTWVFDASPSARPVAVADRTNTVVRVLDTLDRLPRQFARREEFVELVVATGIARDIAQWLAMNVVPDGHGMFASRLDVAQLRALLGDYFACDLWRSLDDASRGDVEIVIAERSPSLDASDRARLDQPPPHVHVHRVDADHWLNVSAPEAVIELIAVGLP